MRQAPQTDWHYCGTVPALQVLYTGDGLEVDIGLGGQRLWVTMVVCTWGGSSQEYEYYQYSCEYLATSLWVGQLMSTIQLNPLPMAMNRYIPL